MAVELPVLTTPAQPRAALVRRARALAWLGVGWHVIEAALAIGAGLAASSIALTGWWWAARIPPAAAASR